MCRTYALYTDTCTGSCIPAWLQGLPPSRVWRTSTSVVDLRPAFLQGMRETYGMYADTLRGQLGSTAPPTSAAMSTVVQHAEASSGRQQTVLVSSHFQQDRMWKAIFWLLTVLHGHGQTCGCMLLAACVA